MGGIEFRYMVPAYDEKRFFRFKLRKFSSDLHIIYVLRIMRLIQIKAKKIRRCGGFSKCLETLSLIPQDDRIYFKQGQEKTEDQRSEQKAGRPKNSQAAQNAEKDEKRMDMDVPFDDDRP